ncbi:MAG: tetratricopeptide repeat protein, partial [Candidatus Hodarchaeota archaeon]
MLEVEEFTRIKQLINKGQYSEAQHAIEKLKRQALMSKEDLLTCQLLMSTLLCRLGDYQKSLTLAREVLHRSQAHGNQQLIVEALIVLAEAFWRLGQLDNSLEIIIQGEQLLQNNEIPFKRAAFLYCKGVVFRIKGKYNLAMEFLEESLALREESSDPYFIAESLNAIGIVCSLKGDMKQALKYFQRSLRLREELGNPQEIASSLNNIGLTYWHRGEVEQALNHFQHSLVLMEEHRNPHDIATSLNNMGLIYWQRGELEQALNHFQRSLVLMEELGNPHDITKALNNIGLIYWHKGDLEQALNYQQRSLSIREELGNPQDLALSLSNVGQIYWHRGDLEQALNYQQRSLSIREELGNPQDLAMSLSNIGHIYWHRGDMEQALNYQQRSLSIREELGNPIEISYSLFHLITGAIDSEALETASQYLNRLHQIDERENNKIINQRYRVVKALMLKTSTRMSKRVEAQEILQKIVDEDILDHFLTMRAMLNLCELLIDELKMYGDPDVFRQIKAHLTRIHDIALHQRSYPLIVEVLLLRAKFTLIDGDAQGAHQLLEQAKINAKERGLNQLHMKIIKEQEIFQNELEKWSVLIERNAPLKERLDQARIEDYLKNA